MKRKDWKEKDLKFIIESWSSMTNREIADTFKRSTGAISTLASFLRRKGIALPRKSKRGYLAALAERIKADKAFMNKWV